MNVLVFKQTGAVALIVLNLVLLILAFRAYRQKQNLAGGYFTLLPVSAAVAAIQVTLGLSFLTMGMQAHGMHIFYGALVGAGALSQAVLASRSAYGQRFRGRPLVHAFLALFVLLLSVRSWLSA